MSHHIYHTRGLILGSVSVGESNRFYKLFTEELGLVGASAQSVREGKSKLRYVLQDFSWVFVDLVRGKEVWRIVSASSDIVRGSPPKNPQAHKVFVRICSVVTRFVHGESREDLLFGDLCAVFDLLYSRSLEEKHLVTLETLAILRILEQLGYADEPTMKDFLRATWSPELVMQFEPFQKNAILSINKAFRESHL